MRRAALGHEEMIACADCGRAGECASVQRGVSECATVCDSVQRGVSVQQGVSVRQGVCNDECAMSVRHRVGSLWGPHVSL